MIVHDEELGRRVKARYGRMCDRRNAWKHIYFLIAKYLLMRNLTFSDNTTFGTTPSLTVADVADDEVMEAAKTAATALGSALWPNTSESFELVMREEFVNMLQSDFQFQSEDVKFYIEEVTRRMRAAIDSENSNFHLALGEYVDSLVHFGTGGLLGEENETDNVSPFSFRALSIETCVIDEGARGKVDTVYFEFAYTVRQLVEKYGEEAVSDTVRDRYRDERGRDDYIRVIQAVEPRRDGKKGAANDQKPWASIHMEVETGHILKNSGMDELCAFVGRFRKLPNEVMGRSLAMDAIPTIRELNTLRRSYSLALGKMLDPPLGFFNDMVGGAGKINLSMGARVPLYATGKIPQGQMPIVNLLPIQEPRVATQRIEQLTERAKAKFLIDRLLDLGNKTRMTAKEAEMRNDYRNQALGNIFSRQMVEVLQPLITWVFNLMMRRGLLGLHPVLDEVEIQLREALGEKPFVIPDAIASMMARGQTPFTIKFISPAARAMRADALMGLNSMTNVALTFANAGVPEALDNIDTDKFMRVYQGLAGAPSEVMRSADKVVQMRKARDQMRAQMANLQGAEQQSQIQKNAAKAAKDFAQAGVTPGVMLGAA